MAPGSRAIGLGRLCSNDPVTAQWFFGILLNSREVVYGCPDVSSRSRARRRRSRIALRCRPGPAVRSAKPPAVAEEVSRTRKLSTCLIRVTDDAGELVALFKGIAYIKATPLGAEAGHCPTPRE